MAKSKAQGRMPKQKKNKAAAAAAAVAAQVASSPEDPYVDLKSETSAFAQLKKGKPVEEEDEPFIKVGAVPVGQRRSDLRKAGRRCDGSKAEIIVKENLPRKKNKPTKKNEGAESENNKEAAEEKKPASAQEMFNEMIARSAQKKKEAAIQEEAQANGDSAANGEKNGRKRRISETIEAEQRYVVEEPESGDEGATRTEAVMRTTRSGRTVYTRLNDSDFAKFEQANGLSPYHESDDDDFVPSDGEEGAFGDEIQGELVRWAFANNGKIGEDEDEEDEDQEDEDEGEGDDEEEDEDEEEYEEDEEFEDDEEAIPGSDPEYDDVGEELGTDESSEMSVESASELDSDSSHVSDESYQEAVLGEGEELSLDDLHPSSTTVDFTAFPFNCEDSVDTATQAFQWMVSPCDIQSFFGKYFQSTALVLRRRNASYNGNLFSTQQFETIVREQHVEYGINLNIAEYKNGVRITPNRTGRVYPSHVSEALRKGWSVQLTNPQAFSKEIWYLCDALQELFHCFVGANCYLTPAKSAGFAPHWDEIDAFLVQVEGKKYWKVYSPLSADDELPLESSGNFTDDDMRDRQPAFEGWLNQGDLLYIPRGWIHQASTCPNTHSLHVTISVGRQWSFADLLKKFLPEAIEGFGADRSKARRQLPPGLFDMAGVADLEYPMMESATEKFDSVLDRHLSVFRRFVAERADSAVDLMAREFMKTALPPVLTDEEREQSAHGSGDLWKNALIGGTGPRITLAKQVRLARRHGQRLIYESEERCFFVHRMANSRVYEGRPEQCFDFPIQLAPIYAALHSEYPDWVKVGDLGGSNNKDDKLTAVRLLFDNGLLLVRDDRVSVFERISAEPTPAPAPKKKNKNGNKKARLAVE